MFRNKLKYVLITISISILTYGIIGLLIYKNYLIEALLELKINILIGLIIISTSYLIKFFRWRLILRYLRIDLPFTSDACTWMSSFAFTATPGKFGETIRSYVLYKNFSIPKSKTISALIFERLSDLFSVFLILFLNFSIVIKSSLISNINFKSILYTTFFSFFTIYFLISKRYIFNKYISKLFPNLEMRKLLKTASMLKELLKPRLVLISLFLGSIGWYLECFALWNLIKGLNISFISIGEASLAHLGSGILGIISMMPGGMGVNEISAISILTSFGIDVSQATIASILIRMMTLWFATFLGIICLSFSLKSE